MQVGDVWQITFPFNDQPGSKLRPVLVVGASPMGPGEEEVVLTVMITSQMHQRRRGDVEIVDYTGAGLSSSSLIKSRRLFAASPRMFSATCARRMGRVDTPTFQAVFAEIAQLF